MEHISVQIARSLLTKYERGELSPLQFLHLLISAMVSHGQPEPELPDIT